MADPPLYPGVPRWVKISAIVAGILALVIFILMVMQQFEGGKRPNAAD